MKRKKGQKKNSKNNLPSQNLTQGQRLADKITGFGGSWTFIMSLFIFLILWMLANVIMIIESWDPYPFILLNLVLSCLAAMQAPIILMSQNRQAERDRAKAERDYYVNRKAEREIALLQEELTAFKELLKK